MKIEIQIRKNTDPYDVTAFIEYIAHCGHKFKIKLEDDDYVEDNVSYTTIKERMKYFDTLAKK
jgi:hypothetical protein